MILRHDHATARSTIAPSLGQLFLRSAERYEGAALRFKRDGRWVDISYPALGAAAREIARGLVHLGIEPADRVAILSDTRPEWTLADAGTLCAAATVVPVYPTNSPEECEYVLSHSGSRAVFCEDATQVAKIDEIRHRCPALEHVVLLTGEADGAMSLAELRAAGQGVPDDTVDKRLAGVRPGDLATLVYTSGTTGPPKGCMLTHANWTAAVDMYVDRLGLAGGTFFLFLPLAHVMARITQMFTLDIGATLVFWQGDPAALLDDLREANPTHFAAVPRLFEKIHTAASVGIAQQSAVKRGVFNWALRTGRKVRAREDAGERVGWLLQRRHALADRLVLSKIRALFGDRLDFAISAAAPIAADVLSFFNAAGVRVIEAYGMTESTAAGAINTVDEWRVGTVGRALPPGELQLAEDGEILMSGPHVFQGYFKDPEATAETVADGWIRTGDLGSRDEDGFVAITGRKKDIIITSSGKNITPTNIENALRESRWISQATVYGDRRPYLVALITLDPDEIAALAEQTGAQPDAAAMAGDERVRSVIWHEIDAVNERFARIEQIKRFAVLPHDLTQTDGELTPTLKVKRRIVYDKYAPEIDRLYE
ncbi:MAG: AMP-dependent synthetase/ligase [Solirubrobacteraceae bacterium]